MKVEVVGKTYYTVNLTDEDMVKLKQYIKDNKKALRGWNMEKKICVAIEELYYDGEIELYSDGKATESDFSTEEVNWSEFEDRTAKEIMEEIRFSSEK